ncbi:MAG: hypothetical protein HOO67_03090 [Candidatus Peribacteraceae bacterium]|nr:hypothetical protein [Candidatus Peribacteraceae bacterium]
MSEHDLSSLLGLPCTLSEGALFMVRIFVRKKLEAFHNHIALYAMAYAIPHVLAAWLLFELWGIGIAFPFLWSIVLGGICYQANKFANSTVVRVITFLLLFATPTLLAVTLGVSGLYEHVAYFVSPFGATARFILGAGDDTRGKFVFFGGLIAILTIMQIKELIVIRRHRSQQAQPMNVMGN